jgi:hypothetical protein
VALEDSEPFARLGVPTCATFAPGEPPRAEASGRPTTAPITTTIPVDRAPSHA